MTADEYDRKADDPETRRDYEAEQAAADGAAAAPPADVFQVINGDCQKVMATLPADSVDAIVSDPPYGLEFMGKAWDSFKVGRSEQYASGGSIDPEAIAERSGKGGAGPSYVNRPAKRCAKCGKQAWSGSPCTCPEPEWVLDNSPLRAFEAFMFVTFREAYRVAKPGAHLLAFGGTRTFHRLATAIEEAGWEVRDCVMWVYGSGFPKSLDVSKAIDKAAGATREVIGRRMSGIANPEEGQRHTIGSGKAVEIDVTAPATEEAKRWNGWGTALKPAWEPVIVARKPLIGTVAENVLRHGTGALNVDACRIPMSERDREAIDSMGGFGLPGWTNPAPSECYSVPHKEAAQAHPGGRWPANVIHDGSPDVVRLFPDSESAPFAGTGATRNVFGGGTGSEYSCRGYSDSGSAARFFYSPKAARCDRDDGLEGFEAKAVFGPEGGFGAMGSLSTPSRNTHPTVKPTNLMRYLCRLVTPPGGTVLDPFCGSGSTGRGAVLEGFRFIGIELDPAYVAISRARIGACLADPASAADIEPDPEPERPGAQTTFGF